MMLLNRAAESRLKEKQEYIKAAEQQSRSERETVKEPAQNTEYQESFESEIQSTGESVSYTHLDVYKRQLRFWQALLNIFRKEGSEI